MSSDLIDVDWRIQIQATDKRSCTTRCRITRWRQQPLTKNAILPLLIARAFFDTTTSNQPVQKFVRLTQFTGPGRYACPIKRTEYCRDRLLSLMSSCDKPQRLRMLYPQTVLVPGHAKEVFKALVGCRAVLWSVVPRGYKVVDVFL